MLSGTGVGSQKPEEKKASKKKSAKKLAEQAI